jgi:hypothetical protein
MKWFRNPVRPSFVTSLSLNRTTFRRCSDLQALRLGENSMRIQKKGITFIRFGLSKQDRQNHLGSKIHEGPTDLVEWALTFTALSVCANLIVLTIHFEIVWVDTGLCGSLSERNNWFSPVLRKNFVFFK